MRNLCWICWFLWESFSTLVAHPISPILTGSDDFWHRELYWLKYALGVFGISITAFTLVGCLCCHRSHRSKGFEEFKDQRSADHETTLHHSFVGLELEVPRSTNVRDQIQFDPLPIEHVIRKSNITHKPKPPSPTSIFEDENGATIQDSCREWCNATDIHLSREKLKYLREIGQGWFGKVVEGRADLDSLNVNDKIGNVVVKILSDQATAQEKAWFLGEATPYFKLRHRNILTLIGCCLETDPYLLIFESCPFGDLKHFLRSNHDPQSRDALLQENMLTRIALEVGAGLQHMHDNGFAHTDLSARNCLVATDLSIKLGDYGTGVEKYPLDYYVIGDRALPIRWSAPESLECTETTIETRDITPFANIWSYAVLLWEIMTWGERPYDELDDEQLIQMLLFKSGLKSVSLELIMKRFKDCSCSLLEVINLCLVVDKSKRISLENARQILLEEHLKREEFEHRWETLRPNATNGCARSASLKDLRGSVDSESWPNMIEEKLVTKPQASFRLGPQELVKNIPGSKSEIPFRESDSETEEESWRMKVERGEYTEKVKLKSKSVTDLMILVHIDSDSDADWSLGPQVTEKSIKKRLTLFGSDSDVRSKTLANEFDQELKKIRDTSITTKPPKLITEYKDNSLSLDTDKECSMNGKLQNFNITKAHKDVPDYDSNANLSEEIVESLYNDNSACFYNKFEVQNVNSVQDDAIDVVLWNQALDSALEKKVFECGLDDLTSSPTAHSILYHEHLEIESNKNDVSYSKITEINADQCPSVKKENSLQNLLKPDEERSSDADFRRKESCDEAFSEKAEENADEEQLRVLLELDSILDAECSVSLTDSLDYGITPTASKKFCSVTLVNRNEVEINENHVPSDDEVESKEEKHNELKEALVESALSIPSNDTAETKGQEIPKNDKLENNNSDASTIPSKKELDCIITSSMAKDYWIEKENDEDSSTVSLHSENSYVSFSLDEEFVAAIRNELREKLPQTQMSVIELPDLRDEDEPSICSDRDSNNWDDDDVPDLTNRPSGVDISIRYNIYDTPLSPIFEERESNVNSESIVLKDESKDTSIASKDSVPDEDLLLMDTQMSKCASFENNENLRENTPVNTKRKFSESEKDNSTSEQVDYSNEAYLYNEMGKSSQGALLPSPEEESKWQQHPSSLGLSLPLHLQIQGDLMSTSFVGGNDWDSQEENEDLGEEEENDVDDDDEEDDDADNDEEADEEENSSSSGEFVYKQYNTSLSASDVIQSRMDQAEKEEVQTEKGKQMDCESNDDEDDGDCEDDDEEEFTPSAWDANLAPHRSALRSPDKTLKSNDQKKTVWFKKQRYHCVYEYPKEAPTCVKDQISTQWEPTSYADWEEMMSEPRLDLYSIDDDTTSRDEEFCISSSNRPFQFQSGDGSYVSQFFPGAEVEDQGQSRTQEEQQTQHDLQKEKEDEQEGQQNRQLGELRHTRDRLKLNLTTSNDVAGNTVCTTLKQSNNNNNNNSDEKQLFAVDEMCNDNILQPVDSPKSNK